MQIGCISGFIVQGTGEICWHLKFDIQRELYFSAISRKSFSTSCVDKNMSRKY